jgi:hypothetical protein
MIVRFCIKSYCQGCSSRRGGPQGGSCAIRLILVEGQLSKSSRKLHAALFKSARGEADGFGLTFTNLKYREAQVGLMQIFGLEPLLKSASSACEPTRSSSAKLASGAWASLNELCLNLCFQAARCGGASTPPGLSSFFETNNSLRSLKDESFAAKLGSSSVKRLTLVQPIAR